MSVIIPDSLEIIVLNNILTLPLTLKLYGNNKTPAHGDSSSSYTEISGGGYTSKPLILANWTITAGEPSIAVYNASQTWTFTGVINSPGTIFGYYITRNSDSQLILAERFPAANVPFAPVNGSKIVVLPRVTAQSEF